MKPSAKILISNPCSEKWDEMLPQEKGKWCINCERIILDFTNKSDQEILDHIKASNGNICGRFNQTQLDRELVVDYGPKVVPLWQKVAASLLFFVGVENAQARKVTPLDLFTNFSITSSDTDKNIGKERRNAVNAQIQTKANGDTIKVYGKVVDEKTKEGIPFAVVKIIDSNVKTTTDFDGYYYFKITKEQLHSNLKIHIEIIGYYPTEDFLRYYNINEVNSTELVTHMKSRDNEYNVVGGLIYIEKKWWQFWK